MEIVAAEIDGIHFRVRDFDGFGILVFVETAVHRKPARCGRRCDVLTDDLVADQRLTTPVLRDEGADSDRSGRGFRSLPGHGSDQRPAIASDWMAAIRAAVAGRSDVLIAW
jgi:hypothetical protein